jgi:type I restriction enzyme S subunit
MKYGKMPPKGVLADEGFPVFSGYRITGFAKEYLFDEPRVIVVARGVGGTGDVKISPEKSWITNLSIVFDHDSSIVDRNFLYYQLGREPLKEKLNTGAAQAQITIENLSQYQITLPSIKTQRRIASILFAYDDLIENNRRRIQLLEQAARLLYKEWFVYLRFPGHEHTQIKDGIPEGWERITVPEVVDINPREHIAKGSDIHYIPMSSLSETGMTVDLSETEIRKNSTSVRFRNGDTLFARITPCLENGKTGYVNFLKEGEVACGSTEFIILRGMRVSPFFTYCLARTYDFRENAIKSMIGSSGRQRVQTSCFTEYVIGLPPKYLLKQFDDAASRLFAMIKCLMKQIRRLSQSRDLLLPRLMDGEVAV